MRSQSKVIQIRLQIVKLLCFVLALGVSAEASLGTGAGRRFTIADDIELWHFGDRYTSQAEPVTFSPDNRYFVVDTEHGRLDLNRPESMLRVYRTSDVARYIKSPENTSAPVPICILRKSSNRDGPIITHIRWLADSSGIAFLEKNSLGNDQLFLLEVPTGVEVALTLPGQHVVSFDVRDRGHYVYCVQSPLLRKEMLAERQATVVAARGHSIYNLVLGQDNPHGTGLAGYDLAELWAVADGKPFPVKDSSGRPVLVRSDGEQALALSPDGLSVVTALAVPEVPASWETLYAPPWSSAPYRIKPGRQDPSSPDESAPVNEYALIRLHGGRTRILTGAPIGDDAGWWAFLKAGWSPNGRMIVLPDTFLPPNSNGRESKINVPCTAVVDLEANRISCLAVLEGMSTGGRQATPFHLIRGVAFLRGSNSKVEVQYLISGSAGQSRYFSRRQDGSWFEDDSSGGKDVRESRPVDVVVRQSLNARPVLAAVDQRTGVSKILWDPNPQLNGIPLGHVSVFRWKDQSGRDWTGGLYVPPDYALGKRYPLVIQTHGFRENDFETTGAYTTAFAAQALAAAGIVVLQVRDCSVRLSPVEAPCQVEGYEAAVEELSREGVVDPGRVGIIGFSRTCYYVMQAITSSKFHFRAASITDGFLVGYVEYIMQWDNDGNAAADEAAAMIGAAPFGHGLEDWLKRSPEFNLDKVSTPLQIVARGRADLLSMWEPYAGLRFLKKPVDLILLTQPGTHVLTNPGQRLASETATVDWFRFWLCGEEDPDPRKAGEYARWRELRSMQSNEEAGIPPLLTTGATGR